MGEVLTNKKLRTRSALLVALQELLLDRAVDTVSVPQVVARAGVAQGTFYAHFESLPAAIQAIGGLVIGEHFRVLGHATADAADQADLVARTTRQTLTLFAVNPDVGRLLFDSGLPVDGLLDGFHIQLREDIQLGVARREFRVTDLAATCCIFAGAVMGAGLDLFRGRLTPDAIPLVIAELLRLLNVNARKAQRLANVAHEFVPWRALPLSDIDQD
ncbi:TetR family transcriptional regulator [Mycolicibacterium sarraceniae]|uniref:TetR family transcriptional regulator n=1 Tax=Mycolicibacterium sarraceniae TaxID=1534348 RepID=UPI0013D06188|nr:TetR family transcriptional regulator [Mycolicibacterium sarraceniae]